MKKFVFSPPNLIKIFQCDKYENTDRSRTRHCDQGERYYVMPSFGGDRKLLVMDRSNFRILKRKGYITHKALVYDMMLESFYFTPHRDGSGWLTEKDRRKKVRQYFSWYVAEIKAAKERKKMAKKRKKEERKNGTVQCKK